MMLIFSDFHFVLYCFFVTVNKFAAKCLAAEWSLMLSIQSISKSYKKQQVFAKCIFDAAPANALAYSVLTAAGKSTLLHILSGTDTPDSGTILFDGKDLLKNPSLQSTKIGYGLKITHFFPDMTAMDHAKLWYSATKYSIEDDLKDGFLSILKIEPFLHKKGKGSLRRHAKAPKTLPAHLHRAQRFYFSMSLMLR